MTPDVRDIITTFAADGRSPQETAEALSLYREDVYEAIKTEAGPNIRDAWVASEALDADIQAGLDTLRTSAIRSFVDQKIPEGVDQDDFWSRIKYDMPFDENLGITEQDFLGITNDPSFRLQTSWTPTANVDAGRRRLFSYIIRPRQNETFEALVSSPERGDMLLSFSDPKPEQIDEMAVKLEETRKQNARDVLSVDIQTGADYTDLGDEDVETLALQEGPSNLSAEDTAARRDAQQQLRITMAKLAALRGPQGRDFARNELLVERMKQDDMIDFVGGRGVGDYAQDLAVGLSMFGLGTAQAAAMATGNEDEARGLARLNRDIQETTGSFGVEFSGGTLQRSVRGAGVSVGMMAPALALGPAGRLAGMTAGAAETAAIGSLAPATFALSYNESMQEADALEQQGRLEEAQKIRNRTSIRAVADTVFELGVERINPFFSQVGAAGWARRLPKQVFQEAIVEEPLTLLAQQEVSNRIVDRPSDFSSLPETVLSAAIATTGTQAVTGVVSSMLPKTPQPMASEVTPPDVTRNVAAAASGMPVQVNPQAIRPQDAGAVTAATQTNPETLAAVVAMTTNTTPGAAPQSAPVAPVKSNAQLLGESKSSLDDRAKALGFAGIRQMNTQLLLRNDLTDEQRQLLDEYGKLNQGLQKLGWKDASDLADDDFSTWSKPLFTTEINSENDRTDMAKLHLALLRRGEVDKANQVLTTIKNTKRKTDWTPQSWTQRFPDDAMSDAEIDAINSENQDWNDGLDALIERIAATNQQQTAPAPVAPSTPAPVVTPFSFIDGQGDTWARTDGGWTLTSKNFSSNMGVEQTMPMTESQAIGAAQYMSIDIPPLVAPSDPTAPTPAPVPASATPAVTPPEIVAGVEELSDAEAPAIDAELGINPDLGTGEFSERDAMRIIGQEPITPSTAAEQPQTQQTNEVQDTLQDQEQVGPQEADAQANAQTQEGLLAPTVAPSPEGAAISPQPPQPNVQNQIQETGGTPAIQGVPTVSQPEVQTQAGTAQRSGQGQEVADLMAVRDNTATPEQVQRLQGQGLVEQVAGQTVITQAGIQAMPEAERPRLTEQERRAEIQSAPTITPERAALNAVIPEESRAAWTPEELAAAETFLQTQDPSAIAVLSFFKRLRVLDALDQYNPEALTELEREAIIETPQYTQEWLQEQVEQARAEGVQAGDTVVAQDEAGETVIGVVEAQDDSVQEDSEFPEEVSAEIDLVEQLPEEASVEEVQQAAPVSVANASAAAVSAESKTEWLDWMRGNLAHLMRFAEKIWKQATATLAAAAVLFSPIGTRVTVSNQVSPQSYAVAQQVARPATFGRIAPWVASQKPSIEVSQNSLAGYATIDLPETSNQGGEVVLNLSGIDASNVEFRKSPLDQAKSAAKKIKGDNTMVILPKRAAKHFLDKGSSAQVDALSEMLYEQESTSPKIAEMLREMGVEESPDTFPWCAASISYALTRAGTPTSITSSRAFLNVGSPKQRPAYGDLVVLWNNNPDTGGKNGWGGHVGFYLGEVDGAIAVLSGNAKDEVNVSLYSKDRVLGYRRVSPRQSRRRRTKIRTTSGNVTVPTAGLVRQAPQSLSRKPGLAQALMESDGAALQLGISQQDVERGINALRRQIPGANNIWFGTRQAFLDTFGNDPAVQDMVQQLEEGVMTEGFYVPSLQRGFLFTDSVVVYQGDADRAALNGTTPAVEAAKRLIRHEVGGHGGWMTLTQKQQQQFMDIARDVIPISDMNQMIEDGYPFQDWQTDEEVYRQAAEEWFSQRLGRLDKLPETGPMARFVDWLKGVWRWLTGRKGDPDLDAIKNLWRQIRMNQAAIATGRAWYSLPRQGAAQQVNDARDVEYLAAVEAGDMETAQRMVDEAAERQAGLPIKDAAEIQTEAARATNDFAKQIEFYQRKLDTELSPEREEAAIAEAKVNRDKWIQAGLNPNSNDPKSFLSALDAGLAPVRSDDDVRRSFEIERNASIKEIDRYKLMGERFAGKQIATQFKTGSGFVARMYHATPFGRLTTFDAGKLGTLTGAPSATKAHFFAGDPKVSETYFADDSLYLKHKGFLALTGDQKKELVDALREEFGELDSISSQDVENTALSLFEEIDSYDTSPVENVLHEVFVSMKNPLVFDFKGSGYREKSFSDLIDQAIQNGHDGVVFANTYDAGPAAMMDDSGPSTNVFAIIAGNESQIKSADPVTRDDQGNVIPLSQRFQATSPDIRYSRVRSNAELLARTKEVSFIPMEPETASEQIDVRDSIYAAFRGDPDIERIAKETMTYLPMQARHVSEVALSMWNELTVDVRDPSVKSEMTPEEAVANAKTPEEVALAEADHRDAITQAINFSQPVSAEAVARYGIVVPDDYALMGALYARFLPNIERAMDLVLNPESAAKGGFAHNTPQGLAMIAQAMLAGNHYAMRANPYERNRLKNYQIKLEKLQRGVSTEGGRTLAFIKIYKRVVEATGANVVGALQNLLAQKQEAKIDSVMNVDDTANEVEKISNDSNPLVASELTDEIAALWDRMMRTDDIREAEAIADVLKSLMPRRQNAKRQIASLFPQAGIRDRMNQRGTQLVRNFFQMLAGPRDQQGPLAQFDDSIQSALSEMLRKVVKDAGLLSQNESNQPDAVDRIVRSLSSDPLRFDKIEAADALMQQELDAIEDVERREVLRQAWEEATASMRTNIANPSWTRRAVNDALAGAKVAKKDWKAAFDTGTPRARAVAAIRQKAIDDTIRNIESRLTVETDESGNVLPRDTTVQRNLDMIRQEIGEAFDQIAEVKYASWLRDRARAAEQKRLAAMRASIVAALRKQKMSQDTIDRLEKAMAEPKSGFKEWSEGTAPATKRTAKPTNPLRDLIDSHSRLEVPDFIEQAVAAGLATDDATRLRDAITRYRNSRYLAPDSPLLSVLFNQIKNKVAGDIGWADLISVDQMDGQRRQEEIFKRIRNHDALKGLDVKQQVALTNALNRLWLKKKQEVMKRELQKLGLSKGGRDPRVAEMFEKVADRSMDLVEFRAKAKAVVPVAKWRSFNKQIADTWRKIRSGEMTPDQLDELIGKPRKIMEVDVRNIIDSTSEILRYMNLGMWSAEALRDSISEKYGVKSLNSKEAKEIEDLARQAYNAEPGLPRDKLLVEIMRRMADFEDVSLIQLFQSFRIANLLFSARTFMAAGLTILNSARKLLGLATYQTLAATMGGSPQRAEASWVATKKFFQAMPEAATNALAFLTTGDFSLLPSITRDLDDAFKSGRFGYSAVQMAQNEKIIKGLKQLPRRIKDAVKEGEVTTAIRDVMMSSFVLPIVAVQRIMGAIDLFVGTVSRESVTPLVAALNPDIFDLKKVLAEQRPEAYRKAYEQAQRELFGRPAKSIKEKAEASTRAREYIARIFDPYLLEEADAFAAETTYQVNPTGVGGLMYSIVQSGVQKLSAMTKQMQTDLNNKLAREEMSAIERESRKLAVAAMRFIAEGAPTDLGVRFIRFTGNRVNELISLTPVLGLLRLKEQSISQSQIKKATLAADQAFAGAFTLFAIAFIMEEWDDEKTDEERGWYIEGPWNGLTPAEKDAAFASGKKPYTFAVRVGGKWLQFNYREWQTAGLFTTLGAMMDRKRYQREAWEEQGIAGAAISGIALGLLSFKDMSSMSQMMTLAGNNPYERDPVQGSQDAFGKFAGGYASSMFPTFVRDVDYMMNPEHRKAEFWHEQAVMRIPFGRLYAGQPDYDFFMEPVLIDRGPLSRVVSERTQDPARIALGKLNTADINATAPNLESRIVGRGMDARPMTTSEKVRFQQRWNREIKRYLVTNTDRLLRMKRDEAQEKIRDDIGDIKQEIEDAVAP